MKEVVMNLLSTQKLSLWMLSRKAAASIIGADLLLLSASAPFIYNFAVMPSYVNANLYQVPVAT